MPALHPLPTTPTGRAALVAAGGAGGTGGETADQVGRLGFDVDDFADPYTAMAAVCRRPLVYRVVVLCLQGLYREELEVVAAVRGRFPHVEVWLARTDGRPAALAEGIALGATALLADDGLHRLAPEPTAPPPASRPADDGDDFAAAESPDDPVGPDEPLLSSDELRALLQDESNDARAAGMPRAIGKRQ